MRGKYLVVQHEEWMAKVGPPPSYSHVCAYVASAAKEKKNDPTINVTADFAFSLDDIDSPRKLKGEKQRLGREMDFTLKGVVVSLHPRSPPRTNGTQDSYSITLTF